MKISHLSFSQISTLANSKPRLLKWREQALRRAWAGFGTREMFTVASAGWYFPEIRDAFKRVLAFLESPELTAAATEAAKTGPVLPPRNGDDWQLLGSYLVGDYRSQGYGAAKYAECRAQLRKHSLLLDFPNLSVRVRESDGNGGSSRYLVEVLCHPKAVSALRFAGDLPQREFVRLCWKFGCQPRVFLPFLPLGYEAEMGLDFFGNDLKAAVAE